MIISKKIYRVISRIRRFCWARWTSCM